MKNQVFGAWTVVAAVSGLSLSGVVACGQGFGRGDCKANRSCGGPNVGEAGSSPSAGETAAGQPESTVGGSTASTAAGDAGAPEGLTAGGAADSLGGTFPGGGTGGTGYLADQPNPPPWVMAISPDDQATSADPDASIVITFSELLKPDTVTSDNIKVFDGDKEIPGTLDYRGHDVTFTPAVPLFMLESYRVSVGVGVAEAGGVTMAAAYASTFTTRDGAWTTIDAVSGTEILLSNTLPISATGRVLLAWKGGGFGDGCTPSARWFRLGAADGPTQASDHSAQFCDVVTSAANAAGVGILEWHDGSSTFARQFRDGAWSAKPATLSKPYAERARSVAVSPTGMATYMGFDYTAGFLAWRTEAGATWSGQPEQLSTDEALSAASIAFDAGGNGLAVWAAQTAAGVPEILASRYLAGGKWGAAQAIPDTYAKVNQGAFSHAPSIAMTPEGDALVVWVETLGEAGNQVNASLFSPDGGWSADARALAGHLSVPSYDKPGIAYDGQGFVVAWAAQPSNIEAGACGTSVCTYTDRYDPKTSKWSAPKAQQTQASTVGVAKMPFLASDGRGDSMLVWARPATGATYTWFYQSYRAGKWSGILPVPGGTLGPWSLPMDERPLSLSMNESGMAAISWGNFDGGGSITTIRLASFY